MAGLLKTILNILSKINRGNLEICRISAMVFVAAIAVIVVVGIFWRYVLNDALSWYEELAKFLMVWLVFVGASLALRFGDHVAIEVFPNLFPLRLRKALMAIISLIISIFLVLLAIKSFQFAWNGRTQVAIAIGDLSLFWIFVSIPFGSVSMLLIAIQQFFENLSDSLFPGSRSSDPFYLKYHSQVREVG